MAEECLNPANVKLVLKGGEAVKNLTETTLPLAASLSRSTSQAPRRQMLTRASPVLMTGISVNPRM
jgi:hypothetical protein